MPDEKILIVDDEKPINDLIKTYLQKEGFLPIQAYNGKEAMEAVLNHNPDFMILDIMLPDVEGTNLCLEIRKKSNAPILFLSCKGEEMDKIIALSVGGDDYMTKPFQSGELIARIKAHLRRHQMDRLSASTEQDEAIYDFPGLHINMMTHEVIAEGKPVNLTAKEFEMLSLFVKNPKRIFNADQLFELAWKTNAIEGDAKTVMVYVSTLRKKIEPDPSNPKYIISIRGFGYKFNHNLADD